MTVVVVVAAIVMLRNSRTIWRNLLLFPLLPIEKLAVEVTSFHACTCDRV